MIISKSSASFGAFSIIDLNINNDKAPTCISNILLRLTHLIVDLQSKVYNIQLLCSWVYIQLLFHANPINLISCTPKPPTMDSQIPSFIISKLFYH
jgi:hypothetical protein